MRGHGSGAPYAPVNLGEHAAQMCQEAEDALFTQHAAGREGRPSFCPHNSPYASFDLTWEDVRIVKLVVEFTRAFDCSSLILRSTGH